MINPNVTVSATYSSIAQNILTPGCVSCHGGAGGYSFDTYAHTLQAVVPGNPGSSPLYTSVKSGAMPQSGNPLSTQQVQAISEWISAGAPNN